MTITPINQPILTFDHIPIQSANDVDKLLIMADAILHNERRSMVPISTAIIYIVDRTPYGLRYLEGRYRALSSDTFLVGMPSKEAPKNVEIRFKKKKVPYWLWVGVNGRREADSQLSRLGFTYEENLRHLDKTGFMNVKKKP